MADVTGKEQAKEYSVKEKLFYFFIIPLVFTLLLGSFLVSLVRQNKETNLTNAVVRAVKSDAQPIAAVGKWAVSLAKKTNQPSSTQSPSSQISPSPSVTQQPNTISATEVSKSSSQSNPGQSSGNGNGKAAASVTANPAAQASPSAEPNSKNNVQSNNVNNQPGMITTDYANMNPSKAASIIGEMSIADADLVLYPMNTQQRSAILAKLDPKKASEISLSLKDYDPTQTANQAKIKNSLDLKQSIDDIIGTYAQMPPQNAEKLLGPLFDTDPSKVILILKGMNINARSQILSAMIADTKDPKNITRATNITQSLIP